MTTHRVRSGRVAWAVQRMTGPPCWKLPRLYVNPQPQGVIVQFGWLTQGVTVGLRLLEGEG